MVISLILLIGSLCQAKTVILGENFVGAAFVFSKHWWRSVFQGRKSTMASILCKASWLQHTHISPPPPAPISEVLSPPFTTGGENFLTDLL